MMLAASDLALRNARWRTVEMPFDSAALDAGERRMVNELVAASQALDEIYWRQSDPEGLKLLDSLRGKEDENSQALRRLLIINGARFDLIDDNAPFAGTEPMPSEHGLYPKGVTREVIEQYVKVHPEKRDEIYSPYTVVRWRGKELAGVPYHEAFQPFLDRAAKHLRAAAALSADPHFANFLRLRAQALATDDYFESDLAWLDLKDPKFDVIFAPYETYLDDVLGVKTSYGAAVLIRNEAESRKLAVFARYVPDIQDALPLAPADRPSKRGLASPMEVMDSPFRAGDLRHGYQAVADNLPNDPRIHAQKGSKKIFFKNFMDARVNYVILPIAKRLLDPAQAERVSGEGYLTGTLLHEISHGLGPAYARKNGKQVDIREAIGPVYSALEEAKADVVGLYGLKWLIDHGALPEDRLGEYYASYVAGYLRTLRFGTAEAHGLAEIMEFNYLSERKAIVRDQATGRYAIDYGRMSQGIADLAKELLEIEATGDAKRAEQWFARYRAIPSELQQALAKITDVPVDIDPVFSVKEDVWQDIGKKNLD